MFDGDHGQVQSPIDWSVVLLISAALSIYNFGFSLKAVFVTIIIVVVYTILGIVARWILNKLKG
jgi:NADH:ubiquinone oxidoreductase subunit 6 (subunit J)